MNQFLSILPILFASLAGQEKAFIIDQGVKYVSLENTRLGNPLSPTEVNAFVSALASIIIAEESALIASAKAAKK